MGLGIFGCKACDKLARDLRSLTQRRNDLLDPSRLHCEQYPLVWFKCSDPTDFEMIGLQPIGFPTLLFFSDGRPQNGWQGFANMGILNIYKTIFEEITSIESVGDCEWMFEPY